MLSVFNIVRLSIYAAVCVWTFIVLGLAVHLEHMLISNDLTRFIPLAIFISVCTLIILPTLVTFGFLRRQFLVQQTRVELGFVGLLGLLWFILGIYTATAQDTEVECDMDGDGNWEESDEFSTDTFQAQYHTIEAFAIFNAILLFAFFFLLLILAIRQRRQGNTEVWVAPVTQNPWFGATPPPSGKGLPEPVTAGKDKGKKSMAQVVTGTFGGAGKDQQQTSTTPMKAGGHYIIYIPPPPART